MEEGSPGMIYYLESTASCLVTPTDVCTSPGLLTFLKYDSWNCPLKWMQCHEIFDFWVFSRIISHYVYRVISIFYENSRRYSQLKVHYRFQVVDTGGRFTANSHFPLVLLTLVVHLALRISSRIFSSNRNRALGIFRVLGEDDIWKKTWSRKRSWYCSLYGGIEITERGRCQKNNPVYHNPDLFVYQLMDAGGWTMEIIEKLHNRDTVAYFLSF